MREEAPVTILPLSMPVSGVQPSKTSTLAQQLSRCTRLARQISYGEHRIVDTFDGGKQRALVLVGAFIAPTLHDAQFERDIEELARFLNKLGEKLPLIREGAVIYLPPLNGELKILQKMPPKFHLEIRDAQTGNEMFAFRSPNERRLSL